MPSYAPDENSSDHTPLIRRIKDMDPDDQPRERAERYGVGTLAVADLWSLILRTGTPGKPVTEMARDLMRVNGGSLHSLEHRERPELMQVNGIGITKAIQIEAVFELMRRYNLETADEKPHLTSARQIFEYMCPRIGNLPHEEIWILNMSRSMQVISCYRHTSGSATASIFDVKAVIRTALLNRAQYLIMVHNHPSGTLKSSPPDDHITKLLRDAAATMEMPLMDHLIISSTGYYSYAEHGKI